MVIRSKKDYIKSLNKLKPEDKDDLKFCRDKIKKMIDSPTISEESITELYNVVVMLSSLQIRFTAYNLAWLKQGFMEEN